MLKFLRLIEERFLKSKLEKCNIEKSKTNFSFKFGDLRGEDKLET